MPRTTPDRLCISLPHAGHVYTLIFDDSDDGRTAAQRQLGLWAVDRELGFSWIQAAVMSRAVRATEEGCRGK